MGIGSTPVYRRPPPNWPRGDLFIRWSATRRMVRSEDPPVRTAPLCGHIGSVDARGPDLMRPRQCAPARPGGMGLARHESEVAYWVFLATNDCALSSPLRCILKSILSIATLPVYFRSI